MTFNNIILGAAVSVLLYLAYSVGHKRGLVAAPEYVAHKVAQQVESDQRWEQWRSVYESSQGKVCDQIFELVLDYQADSLSIERRERSDEF